MVDSSINNDELRAQARAEMEASLRINRIALLEQEVAELKTRIAALEARLG